MPYVSTKGTREKARLYMQEWRRTHPERAKAIATKWRNSPANREKLKAQWKRYHAEHQKERISGSKAWRLAHPEYRGIRNTVHRELYAFRLAFGLCGRCGGEKPNSKSLCGECAEETGAVNRRSSQKNQRRYNLRRYGLSVEEWNAMLVAQGSRCGLCGTDKPGTKGWQTDHDHENGKVRAILCGPCNLGLGCFRDDSDRLAAAINYLRKHRLTLVG